MGLLRFVLALVVVFAHSPLNEGKMFIGGQLAVESFFAISGFLIHHVLNNEKRYAQATRFYRSRLLRIYPMYIAIAVPSALACMIANQNFIATYSNATNSERALLTLSNLLIIGQDAVLFLPFLTDTTPELHRGLIVPQAWTLSLELTFYAIAPFILKRWITILSFFTLSLLIKYFIHTNGMGDTDPWSYRFFPAELFLFLGGAIANRALMPIAKQAPNSGKIGGALMLPIFVGAIVFWDFININNSIKSATFIAALTISLPWIMIASERSSLDKTIGELSYPIYVTHVLAIWTIEYIARLAKYEDATATTFINIIATIIVASILNKAVGEHFERIRHKHKESLRLKID